MKLVDDRVPAGQRGQPRAPARRSVEDHDGLGAGGRAGLEVLWPRRFDLTAVRDILGEDVDELCCDVLTTGVGAPVWALVDRGGGRWRSAVCRLAFAASGGVPPLSVAIAQVPELLHTGSLIIDDIQDGADERRGGPAAHAIYGVPVALNAANAAYFRVLQALRRTLSDARRLRALDMLAEELFAAHLGQALDLALGPRMREGAVRVAHYVVLARAKTGALVRVAARLGAIAAGADETIERALASWAGEVGVAYQIRNDLDDFAANMRDVAACRPTYPLLLALEDGGVAAAALRARLGAPVPADEELRSLCTRARIAERAFAAVSLAVGRALDALRPLPVGEARSGLEQFARELVDRPGGASAR